MNVACPQCTSVFRVDPAKVPAGGVRARCSVCSGVINVPEPSFEEPVATGGSGGWPESELPAWGRVPTPEGGWTPTPAIPPSDPTPTPARQALSGLEAAPPQPMPFIPPAATPAEPVAPPSPLESAPADGLWGESAPSRGPDAPGQETEPPPADWGAAPAGTSADWGDWPSPVSEPDPATAMSPAASGATVDPWGDAAVNPLAPDAPPFDPGGAVPSAASDVGEEAAPPYHSAEVQADESSTPAYGIHPPPEPAEAAAPAAYEPVAMPAQAPYEPVATPAPPPPEATPTGDRAADSPGSQHVNPFMRRDPHERARRLARALASDIVTYYPDKHAEGLRDGTLRELFREEIKKSYDDYVAHVGTEIAQSTTYFQDALNEVVAGGKRLF